MCELHSSNEVINSPSDGLHDFSDFSDFSSWRNPYEEYKLFLNLLHYAVKLELVGSRNKDKLLYSDLSED
tara:strand:+ start:305 stop:514 length:210 start_codon:yes stop_codon:yes gene_type:complete